MFILQLINQLKHFIENFLHTKSLKEATPYEPPGKRYLPNAFLSLLFLYPTLLSLTMSLAIPTEPLFEILLLVSGI